ncbi:MAG: rhodanese-like domain-containing protein [Candidatus Paceibacterota bacterium]
MNEFETISRDELKEKIDHESDFVLIDVLGEHSFERAHIPGAISIDAHDDNFISEIEAKVPNKESELVIYCASFACGLSTDVARKLIEAGYHAVVDFEGGLRDWARGGYLFEGSDAEEVAEQLSKDSDQ